MSELKANCYKCKYRGNVPGDTHSCCLHPGNSVDLFDFLSGSNRENAVKLGITAKAHGIKNGWFFWPVNFDPVWLISCNGFIGKEVE